MSWQLGLARMAAVTGGDLQRASRAAGGGAQLWAASAGQLARWLRAEQERVDEVVAVRAAFDPGGESAKLAAEGIRHVGLGAAEYPLGLDEIPDPPFGLFVTGTAPEVLCDEAPVVAIVGSRRPTAFGLQFARALARELAEHGATVVSGLALGIDAAAHEGALAAGAATIAVVGCGVDVAYPKRNATLRREILAAGVLLSEYWPGTPPAPWRRWVAEDVDLAADLAAEATAGGAALPSTLGTDLDHRTPATVVDDLAARYASMSDLLTDLLHRDTAGDDDSWRPRVVDALDRCRHRLAELRAHRPTAVPPREHAYLPGELLG